MLHGELVGTSSPQARNLLEAVILPKFLLRGYSFWFGNQEGSWRTMMTSSAWWARPVP